MSEILQLTHDDYKKVLKYYNYSLPKNYNKTKKIAEKLLNNKLCKCIQKVKRSLRTRNKSIKNSESLRNSVGICKKSVLHKKILIYTILNVIKRRNLEIILIKNLHYQNIKIIKREKIKNKLF